MDPQRNVPLVLMRIVIGWHFLYEGLTKLLYPGWTSAGYLKGSSGPWRLSSSGWHRKRP